MDPPVTLVTSGKPRSELKFQIFEIFENLALLYGALIICSVVDLSSDPLPTTSQMYRLAYLLLLTARSFGFRPNVTIVRL